ncbi:Zn(2)-Cys(6) zinc finger domain protein [Metarhizium robertsii]|uniref:Zn(2)-Cys(6) zinc finger domain protein n=1 Tax=Metarhizium robertsii TaxID=568076 RepID=A0A0A1V164_9HYPO|nr:Zn(2)-Cys(6) zinc finger domain protein [Metarhizium robertsii]
MKKRISSSCDACSFRRVKCDAERPCRECLIRGLDCTSLRTRGKRGPKGPRSATCHKINEGVGRLTRNSVTPRPLTGSGSSPGSASSNEAASSLDFMAPTCPRRLPIDAYCKYLKIFRDRLYPVWPVVDVDDLIAKLILDVNDLESYALAASVCAASIAQLRLPEHTELCEATISSYQFARDAQTIREQYDYRECQKLSSILTPFFLHVYFANASKIRTAAVYLRESILSVHWLGLDRQETYESLEQKERSLKLRIFWILFISERPVLDPDKVAIAQSDLCALVLNSSFTEVQQVDLFVTRQWIRLLIWEYTMRHYKMSRNSSNQAFSLLLPVMIARELLSLFLSVSADSIFAHGYGMELKVFRMADALLDILACSPGSTKEGGMCAGIGDILHGLKNVLLDIGGLKSRFLDNLQIRMSNSELAKRPWPYLSMRFPGNEAAGQGGNAVREADSHLETEADTLKIVPIQ